MPKGRAISKAWRSILPGNNALIENTGSWRERRVEVESQIAELNRQSFTGETIPIVEANIQRELSLQARDSGITVSSTRLADRFGDR